VAADYGSGALHPGDLKPALARALNAILQPVRDHFAGDERARKLLAQARPCARRRVRVASAASPVGSGRGSSSALQGACAVCHSVQLCLAICIEAAMRVPSVCYQTGVRWLSILPS